MRALTRMRTVAAACALLLVVAGTAAATPVERWIDRPGTPDPQPPMVGDPDTGHDMPAFIMVVWGRVYFWRLPWMAQDTRSTRPELRVIRRWP